MLRILLAVLCAFTGFAPVVASAAAISPLHDDCCCCAMGHAEEHAGPSLAENPCDCGCLTPARTPGEVPETPRNRCASDTTFLPAMQVESARPLLKSRTVERKRRVSPVPLRGPPDPVALCVWQE